MTVCVDSIDVCGGVMAGRPRSGVTAYGGGEIDCEGEVVVDGPHCPPSLIFFGEC